MSDQSLFGNLPKAQSRFQTIKKSRLPWFGRVPNPPNMRLMERDVEILRLLFHFQAMSREQIEALLFAPSTRSMARLRLQLLYLHRYIDRIPLFLPNRMRPLPVYRLAGEGAKVVAARMSLSVSALRYWGKGFDKDHRQAEVSTLFLVHLLRITEVRVAITLAARAKGYQLEQWINEMNLKSEEMKDSVTISSPSGRKAQVSVVPDGYFVMSSSRGRAHFFLEVDNGTMSNKRWKRRITTYMEYINSGKYAARYHATNLRILTVTTTRARFLNLKRTTEQVGGRGYFWFTTIDRLNPVEILDGQIWERGGDVELHALTSKGK